MQAHERGRDAVGGGEPVERLLVSIPAVAQCAAKGKSDYCAASLAIALSFAAVSSLSEAGCGMATTL